MSWSEDMLPHTDGEEIEMRLEAKAKASQYKDGEEWYWITREGKKIHIKEMDTHHLMNTIQFLIKHNHFHLYYQKLLNMTEELKNRIL